MNSSCKSGATAPALLTQYSDGGRARGPESVDRRKFLPICRGAATLTSPRGDKIPSQALRILRD